MIRRPLAASLTLVFCSACLPITCGPAEDEEWMKPDAGPQEQCWGSTQKGTKQPDDAQVRITGRAVRADGSRAGEKAALIKPMTLGDLFWNIATLGSLCLLGNLSDDMTKDCEQLRTAPLDGQGNFAFVMKASESRTAFLQTPHDFRLIVAAPKQAGQASGAWLETIAEVEGQEVTLPELRLWEPSFALPTGNGRVTVEFGAAPSLPTCYQVEATRLLVENAKADVLWSQTIANGDSVDLRLFEDFKTTVTVSLTQANRYDASQRLILGTPRLPLQGALVPLSRGAACTVGAKSYSGTACTVTDGKPTTSLAPGNELLTVDLGSEKPIELIVLRAELSDARLEVSTDGTRWVAVGDTTVSFSAIRPPSGTRARYLRLAQPKAQTDYPTIHAVREISVW